MLHSPHVFGAINPRRNLARLTLLLRSSVVPSASRHNKMPTKLILGGAVLVALAMIPSCPAPPVAGLVITGVAAPIVGSLAYIGINSNIPKYGYGKRDPPSDDAFVKLRRESSWSGVTDYALQLCKDSNVNKRDIVVTQIGMSCKCCRCGNLENPYS